LALAKSTAYRLQLCGCFQTISQSAAKTIEVQQNSKRERIIMENFQSFTPSMLRLLIGEIIISDLSKLDAKVHRSSQKHDDN